MTHKPTNENREKVKSFAAVGITQEDIARVIKVDAKTLRYHYRDELDMAGTMANAAVGGALFNKARNGDTTAMIWWTKARMGWRGESRTWDESEDSTPVTNITYVEEDASLENNAAVDDNAALTDTATVDVDASHPE